MNILFLNWRDPKNPKSGGAEKLNLEILKPLTERGDSVTWYAQSYKDLPHEEIYQGIRIIRSGNALTHFIFWLWLLWTGKFGKVDYLIDSIHGTGYLSPLVAPRTRKKILICEVAQNIWDEMYAFPINVVGKLWEKMMFTFYRKNTFWTISESTKKDLVKFGLQSNKIQIIPMGFDAFVTNQKFTKYTNPSALFVGRIAEMKGILDAIKAIEKVNKTTSVRWELRIIGRGEATDEENLKRYVNQHQLNEKITFLGFVDEKKKFEQMARSWLLLVPSSREGWGMIVPEANSAGTPVIAYDVPGLRDVVSAYAPENKLIPPKVDALAHAIAEVHRPVLLKKKPKPGWEELYTYIIRSI